MSLKRRLDTIRTQFEAQADPATLAVMHGATAGLIASAQAEQAAGEGDPAPDFELAGIDGTPVRLADLRGRGPVVLTFFRGHW